MPYYLGWRVLYCLAHRALLRVGTCILRTVAL